MKSFYFLGHVTFVIFQFINETYQTQCNELNDEILNLPEHPKSEPKTKLVHITHIYANKSGNDIEPCLLLNYNSDSCGPMFFHGFIIPPGNEPGSFIIPIISVRKNLSTIWKSTVLLERKQGTSTSKHIYEMTLVKLEQLNPQGLRVEYHHFEEIPISQSIKDNFHNVRVSILETNVDENMAGYVTCEKDDDDLNSDLCDKAGWIIAYDDDVDDLEAAANRDFWDSIVNNPRFAEIQAEFLPLVDPNSY